MERIYVKAAREKIGERILLKGWVHIVRDHGNIIFIILRDKTGLIQCVSTLKDTNFGKLKDLNQESVISVEGVVKESKQAPNGIEVNIEEIELLSTPIEELPISVVEKNENEASENLRLDYRWLDLRKPERKLIFKVWTVMEDAFREYWLKNGFTQIHSSKFMNTPSESGAEVFEVKYFDRKAYLAQSPQFYKQMAMAAGFEKVFEIGPVFRAEPSFTSRHATEFTGYDMEVSFIESHQDLIKIEEELLVNVFTKLKEELSDELKEYFGLEITIPSRPFPQITIEELKKILKEKLIISEEGDINQEEEIEICKYIKEKYNHDFVFVTDYPTLKRAFYHMRYEDRPNITKGFDLIYRGIEITTGAQREHRCEILKKQAIEKGMNTESISEYLKFFKYGCPPHGGVGIGPARIVMKLLRLDNIREATFVYRGVKRLNP